MTRSARGIRGIRRTSEFGLDGLAGSGEDWWQEDGIGMVLLYPHDG